MDQGLSSLTNFIIAMVAARQANVLEFAAFGIAFTTYLLLLAVSRAVCTDPLVVRYSLAGTPGQREAVKTSTGAAVALSVPFAGGCALAGVAFSGSLQVSMLALAVSLPGLLLQDSMRFSFFALGRPARAAANDLVWVFGQLVAYAILFLLTNPSPAMLLLGWGLAATLAGAVGPFQARLWPSPQRVLRWFRAQADLSGRYLLDCFALAGQAHLPLYGLALVAGLREFASFRGALLLLGPLNTIFFAALSTVVPEGARLRAEGTGALYRVTRNLVVVLPLLALTWVGLLAFVPESWGRVILGDTWGGARKVVVPLGLMVAVSGVVVAADGGMRALAAAGRGLRARVTLLPLVVVGGLVGATVSGAAGCAVGLLAANAIGAAIFWLQFARAFAEDDPAMGPSTDVPI